MPCIIDNNKMIVTPIRDILESLQQQLYLTRSDKLKRVEYKQQNARVTCPIHKGGHENTPSCDVLLYDKTVVEFGKKRVIPAGTVHCFGCGYQASLVRFISDCLNISYRRATEWLLGFVDYELFSEKRDIGDFDPFRVDKLDNYSELPVITCEDLKQYDYIHPYMFERKLTNSIIDKYEVGYSPKEDALTFPVYVDGKCIFVAKRKVKYKRFIMPKVDPKPIYGLDYIVDSDEIYVTESIINALTLCSYGLPAVALLGTGSKYQIEQLNRVQARKIIICLDGDEAGVNGRKRLIKGLTNKIVTYITVPSDKDINDLSREEFFSLEQVF